jgi:cytochrome c556
MVFAPCIAHADNAEAIDYRKHVMRTLGEHADALAMIVQRKAPAENFKVHVKALALASTQALESFETKAEGGHAKGEIWKSWPDFSTRMNQLVSNLAALDKAAQAGGMAAAAPKIQSLLTCKGCHDTYATLSTPASKPEPDAVTYRHHVMNAIDAQSSAVGQILSGEIQNGDLASNFEVLAVTASGALKAFEPKVPGGEASALVWTQWPDFSKRMNEFAHKTAEAAKVAREQGNEAAMPVAMEALMCKNCHDSFRSKPPGD